MAEKTVLGTITGERFQPVRLHYRVSDHAGLLRALKKLRCVDEDPPRQRRVWLYDHEARKLQFERSYAQIPKHLHPIVIGSLFLRRNDEMLLDLRSCERALLAVPFFDKHLPRKVARVTEAEVVNKLFEATGNESLSPDSLFDRQVSPPCDPEAALKRILELAEQVQDPQERLRIAQEEVEARAKQPLPEIERVPLHYYEEGLGGFTLTLRTRQIVALKHWLGDTAYSMFDAIRSMLSPM
jgi:hypothetical protein